MIRLLLVLALFPGCALVDGTTLFARRAANKIVGGEPATPPRDPLYLQLQAARLSDTVVSELIQATEEPLAAAKGPRERGALLHLRLDYAAALWTAAAGPNPFANAIDILVTLAVGRQQVQDTALAGVLGASSTRTVALLADAEREAGALVQTFLAPAEYQALRTAIETKGVASAQGGLANIDLERLLGGKETKAGAGSTSPNLLRFLGMDPFAGLDPTTREIAESRQFGERVLFSIHRLPAVLRLNAELLSNDVSRDLGFEQALVSLDRASAAMDEVARTATSLPGWLDTERVRLVADVTGQADRLTTLAHDYRAAFEAANTTAAAADQALQTFGGVVDRFQRPAPQREEPARPFDVTEYAQTAARISEAAVNLSALLGRVDATLDSPGVTAVAPQATAVLDEANARGRSLLYTAFALGCALIVLASLAVIATASILRRGRGGSGG